MDTTIREVVHAVCATYYGHNLPNTENLLQWYARVCAEEPDKKKQVRGGLNIIFRMYGPGKSHLGRAFLFEDTPSIRDWFASEVGECSRRFTILCNAYDYSRKTIEENRDSRRSYDPTEDSIRAVRAALTRAQSNAKNIAALEKCYEIIVANMPEAKDALGSTRVKLIATANTNTGCVTTLTAELERLPQTPQI